MFTGALSCLLFCCLHNEGEQQAVLQKGGCGIGFQDPGFAKRRMKLMSDEHAVRLKEEYKKLNDLEKRRVEQIKRDSSMIATPGKTAAVIFSGILSVAIIVVFVEMELALLRHQNYIMAVMFLFPLLLLLVGVFGVYYMYRIKRRTTLEGATECLLQEKVYKAKKEMKKQKKEARKLSRKKGET